MPYQDILLCFTGEMPGFLYLVGEPVNSLWGENGNMKY